MMQGYRFRIRLMSVLVGGLLLAAPALWAQQPRSGGTLRVGWEADVTGLDPFVSPGVQAWHVVGMLFNSLLTMDVNLNFVPDLAESWDVLENGKVYVFHLRKGVTFHDGTDFDAEAVRWNYQRVVDPEEKALDAPYYRMVEAVEALDAHTVTFTLKHPSMTLLPVIAVERAGFLQMSPASYKRWGKEEVRLHPVGTGPFKLTRWDQKAGKSDGGREGKRDREMALLLSFSPSLPHAFSRESMPCFDTHSVGLSWGWWRHC